MLFHISLVDLINIVLIATGMSISCMCFLHVKVSPSLGNTKFRRCFLIIFSLLFLYILIHLFREILEGLPGKATRYVLEIIPLLETITVSILPYTMSQLLMSVTGTDITGKWLKKLMLILLVVQFVLLLAGSPFGLFYYYDQNNIYHRSPGYIISNIIPFLMMIINMILLVWHGKKNTLRVKVAFWVYLIMPLIAIIIQNMFYGIQYIIFSMVAGSVFMYVIIIREQADRYKKQNKSILRLQNGIILVMAELVESRDKRTGSHLRKTAEYVRIIIEQMKKHGVYTDQLTDTFVEDVIHSAPLHDIGKIHVPDAILNKPGKLTDEEYEEIKKHTTAGRDIINSAIEMMSEENSGYLKEARTLAYCHHEKWDGTGYPQGLSGEQIPLSARIMAIADMFDALMSERSYKQVYSFEEAMETIKKESGTHFDPHIAEVFVSAGNEIYPKE
ncbi:MAG: HD domain-containing protein [Spirochaetaceae bacterium]|nr:HD domain-containing protein [Spirochaetaceae bacterium]